MDPVHPTLQPGGPAHVWPHELRHVDIGNGNRLGHTGVVKVDGMTYTEWEAFQVRRESAASRFYKDKVSVEEGAGDEVR